jgi:hypothetical protein
MTTVRHEGPTVHGGAYEIGVYMNNAWRPASPEEATLVIVTEYDENDEMILETVLRRRKEETDES